MLLLTRRSSKPLPTTRVVGSRREHSNTLVTGGVSLICRIFAVARTLLGVAYPSEDSGQANFYEKALFVKPTWRPRCVVDATALYPSRYASIRTLGELTLVGGSVHTMRSVFSG
jgi:hypothetical protein